MATYEDIVKSKKAVTPDGEVYEKMYCDRRCGYCTYYSPTAYSNRVGVCAQSGCTVGKSWVCNLDRNGNLKVTRQKL